MKNFVFLFCFLFSTQLALGQSMDRRTFQGKISSAQTTQLDAETQRVESTSETPVEIVFTARSIAIGPEVFDIVTREFDSKKTTTFRCTKRRTTYAIVYIVGESITVIDHDNDEVRTVYTKLKESR
jgi:hypothetical protein